MNNHREFHSLQDLNLDSLEPTDSLPAAIDQFREVMAQVNTKPVAGLAFLANFPGLIDATEEEFERTLKLICRQVALHKLSPTVVDSVDLCLRFFDYKRSAHRGFKSLLLGFRNWIITNHGPTLRISELTLQIMQTWKNEVMLGTGTPISKAHRVAAIGMWTRFCIQNGWLSGPFFPRLVTRIRPQATNAPVCWTLAECIAYLARIVLYRPDIAPALIVHLQTGLPLTTITNLTRADFDFSKRILQIKGEYSAGGATLDVIIRPSLASWFVGMAPAKRLCEYQQWPATVAFPRG